MQHRENITCSYLRTLLLLFFFFFFFAVALEVGAGEDVNGAKAIPWHCF